ncbi:cupin domain-containing protein [Pontimicrobium sp. MEBiC06410]
MWHFYDGTTIKLHTISPEGQHSEYKIGRDFTAGEVPQLVVSGGDWFAAEVSGNDTYALVGCTVAPGFDFSDFELPNRTELISKFPQHQKIITKLTHN